LYRGMPTETVDVEAGFPVSTTIAAVNGVQAGTLPACRAVQAMHVGGYDTLDTTYEAVKQRMHEEGMKASDNMWEYYLSDQSTDPATWRTLVIWPVL
ncbi:MAG: GyrI-like domain-containing protein, partial [Jiangellaceae bacterium]